MNDSGMSDSQFMRFQKKTKERLQNYIDNYDKDIKVRQISERWKSAKIEKKTLWEKIKESVYVVFRSNNRPK